MITIFNRKELLSTYNMQTQADIRTILGQSNIDYSIKLINRKSPSPFDAGSRAHSGSFGENLALEYEYIIYVKREAFDEASYLIREVK